MSSTGQVRSLGALLVGGLLVLAVPLRAQVDEPPPPPADASVAPDTAGDQPSAEPAAVEPQLTVAADGAALRGLPLRLKVGVELPAGSADVPAEVLVDGTVRHALELGAGEHAVALDDVRLAGGDHQVVVRAGGAEASATVSPLAGWISVLPPLIAIVLALIFKDVLVALFAGIYLGALALFGWHPLAALGRVVDHFVSNALADPDHAKILVFSTLLGGMAAVMTRSGGTNGIVERLSPLATSARRGQLAAWLMGVLVFFDDYANTLIVGNTMRPVTDRLRISREKLAYIVDSTAAPVASVFPISTWIGFEVGLLAGAFSQLHLPFDAYNAFLASIPFRFYPILALVLGFTIAFARRDLGPMLAAERRAATTGQLIGDGHEPLASYDAAVLAPPEDRPHRATNALLPIATVIVVTLVGLYRSGSDGLVRGDYHGTVEWLRAVFSNASSYNALLWASLSGVLVAVLLPVATRVLRLGEAIKGMVEGFKSMMLAVVVLLLAWSIGSVCAELHTADFLVDLTHGVLSPFWLPVLVFIISAAVSFATGTSWATMSILIPLVVPIYHGLAIASGHAVDSPLYYHLLLGTISSVLAGSVWGDHCSPISDTTILSSMGSGCDHIAHVRTQLPYALGVGVLGMAVGDIPSSFGLSPWISLLLGTAIIIAVVRFVGKPSDGSAGRGAAQG